MAVKGLDCKRYSIIPPFDTGWPVLCVSIHVHSFYNPSRLKPTELCDVNYHRNKKMQSRLNGITSLYQK